jgi:predicted nucleic acid-binding protein
LIVVDTNVIAYLFLPGDYSEFARLSYLHDPEWFAPSLWRSEFRSVLSLYIRKRSINVDMANRIAREAELLFEHREYQIASADVFSLVSISSCSAYDCEFVALAKQLKTRLVTSDKQILKAFPEIAVSLREFVGKNDA